MTTLARRATATLAILAAAVLATTFHASPSGQVRADSVWGVTVTVETPADSVWGSVPAVPPTVDDSVWG